MGSTVKRYAVTINGVRRVLKLNDADAAKYDGAELIEPAESPEVNADEAAVKARASSSNKARTSANTKKA